MKCPRCKQVFFIPSQPCPRCGFRQPEASIRDEQRAAMILQGDTYHLEEQQEIRQWSPAIYEAWWRAYDMRNKRNVLICEVGLPPATSILPKFIASAQKALILITSYHPQRMPQLLDVFMEHHHGFFVFADILGDTLAARIQQGAVLQEPEAISCMLQLAETVQAFSQHHPPIMHGAIQPNQIVQVGTSWVLTYCSVLSAGRIWQYFAHMESSESLESLDTSPVPTVASDLSALSAAIYFAVTGGMAPIDSHVQSLALRNAGIRLGFAATIQKGIHAQDQERYHYPYEIIHALQMLGRPGEPGGSVRETSPRMVYKFRQ